LPPLLLRHDSLQYFPQLWKPIPPEILFGSGYHRINKYFHSIHYHILNQCKLRFRCIAIPESRNSPPARVETNPFFRYFSNPGEICNKQIPMFVNGEARRITEFCGSSNTICKPVVPVPATVFTCRQFFRCDGFLNRLHKHFPAHRYKAEACSELR
jgi:hypothetical protein